LAGIILVEGVPPQPAIIHIATCWGSVGWGHPVGFQCGAVDTVTEAEWRSLARDDDRERSRQGLQKTKP